MASRNEFAWWDAPPLQLDTAAERVPAQISETTCWFAQLTNRRLRNGSFDSVLALVEAIDLWASHWNDDPQPFVWHTPAKQIIKKVKRGRTALTHQTKTATHH